MSKKLLVLSVLACMAIAACGNADSAGGPGLKSAGDVKVLTQTTSPPEASGGVGYSGTLETFDGCVGATMGDEPVLLIFPSDTDIAQTDGAVVISVDGVELTIGGTFTGGGRGQPASLSSFEGIDEAVVRDCGDRKAVYLDEVAGA